MFGNRRILRLGIISFFILVTAILIFSPAIHSQYWAALPPYNVLWPLWSPPLVTDFNWDPLVLRGTIPIITELTRNTILPVQPVLALDPCQPGGSGIPWALYNTPLPLGPGLLFYDPFYGMNPWPPSYMLDPVTGAPAPIALPLGWSVILPTALKGLEWYLPLANAYYANQFGLPLTGLLTAVDIWGLTPLALLPPSVI